jgi:uncharacterized small protein (DUF1192 family)
MAIVGKIKTQKPDLFIEKMLVGSSGFIDILEFIVTPKAIFIDILTLLEEGDGDEMCANGYVPILRTGSGLTQDDFTVDVTKIDREFYLEINTMAVYYELIKQKDLFIVFYAFETEDVSEPELPEKESILTQKFRELLEAEEGENYEKAALLRDEIKKIELKKKRKNNSKNKK